jgi:hypothetical protein
MLLMCLGRLPYNPDEPLHFELWQAVCRAYEGGPRGSGAGASCGRWHLLAAVLACLCASPTPARTPPGSHAGLAAAALCTQQQPATKALAPWQLLGFSAANPAAELEGTGVLSLLLLLLPAERSPQLAVRLLAASHGTAEQQQTAGEPPAPGFPLAVAAVEAAAWTLRALRCGELGGESLRLQSTHAAAGGSAGRRGC